MTKRPLPADTNIYETDCPVLYAMHVIGQKWKLPILWYIADEPDETMRYSQLEKRVVGITPTMLTKCLRELQKDGLLNRKQYSTIPPKVEYSLTDSSRKLLPALSLLYKWAEEQMERLDIGQDSAGHEQRSQAAGDMYVD